MITLVYPDHYNDGLESIVSMNHESNYTTDYTFLLRAVPLLNDSPIHVVGHHMYTTYVYYFIMASLILLVAMVGAISLTLHKDIKVLRQDGHAQDIRDHAKTVYTIESPLHIDSMKDIETKEENKSAKDIMYG